MMLVNVWNKNINKLFCMKGIEVDEFIIRIL